METEKQNNYYVVNQFLANVPFLRPLKTAETLLFFRCVLGEKKGTIGLKWVDNSFREIISITTLSTVSLSSFPRNVKVCASHTLEQDKIDNIHRQNT